MLSDKEIVCPNNLLNVAHKKKGVVAGIVNAGKPLPMLSVMDAVKEDLIFPIFIGDKDEIQKCADNLKFDISKFEIIHESVENNTAKVAAKLASENKIRIIVKGHIHTDILMKEVLKREYNLLGKTRLSHIWHMTLNKEDKPLIITDGALNVLPNVKTKMHILKNVINFSNRIGNERPKVAVLSATEEVLDSVQSSLDAKEITELAKKENLNADVFGPLAFDNSISKKSAAIKGIKNAVAGQADVLLVPSVEAGNGLVKMMIYFMGACAAGVVIGGKVPVVITSRSDEAQARLASIAAAVVAWPGLSAAARRWQPASQDRDAIRSKPQFHLHDTRHTVAHRRIRLRRDFAPCGRPEHWRHGHNRQDNSPNTAPLHIELGDYALDII